VAPVCWPGDAALLRVLLRNLVDNALRHSPPGARIEVQVGGDALLTVEDSGPGLDAATAAGLGQRFVRGAEALGSGSGLGWSIAQRIAQVHARRPRSRSCNRSSAIPPSAACRPRSSSAPSPGTTRWC
jgi:signal transduction histidine kinase